jgi:ubiquinone/menaquinone biosynthesis C-methylase UbiE
MLKGGAKVADVGCGFRASTIIMAQAYPRSRFFGFDYHAPSILTARKRAKKAGLKNVEFATAKSTNYPGKKYDFVAHFDCLHDRATLSTPRNTSKKHSRNMVRG